MSEEKKNEYTPEEKKIMFGLVTQIIQKAKTGDSGIPILKIALQVREEAQSRLDTESNINTNYLKACDTIVDIIKKNPSKTISDLFKEHLWQLLQRISPFFLLTWVRS